MNPSGAPKAWHSDSRPMESSFPIIFGRSRHVFLQLLTGASGFPLKILFTGAPTNL